MHTCMYVYMIKQESRNAGKSISDERSIISMCVYTHACVCVCVYLCAHV